MWKLLWNQRSEPKAESSSSAEVNFLDLCVNSVRNMEDLVTRGHLLNLRQCQDLSAKVFKTVQNIGELYSYCGASVGVFRPALKSLYRHVLKAEALLKSCAEKEWCAAAVFQCQNENAFREILLDVSLCYSAIYEHAKSAGHDWTDAPEDLRQSSVLVPTLERVIVEDNIDLQTRLDDHANGYTNSTAFDFLNGGRGVQERFLAKYLLTKMCHTPFEPQASTLDVYSPLLWPKCLEPSKTWGSSRFLGAGSGATGVCSTEWLGIRCAKKDFHEGLGGMFLKEAGILAHLKHPCIVNFICCGNGSTKGDRFIAMELMEKSLFDLIEEQKGVHFAPDVAIDMIVQMARGVWYLHDRGVAHRDLKPQNVVVKKLDMPHLEDHFCVKLVDFGISKMKVEVSQLNTMTAPRIGTTSYRAPEANPSERVKVDWFKADAYSFAITCAHLLSLETPFQGLAPSELYKEVSVNAQRPKLPDKCPKALVRLLRDCWKSNPRLRPSFKEICVRLETLKYGDVSVDGDKGSVGVDLTYIKKKMEEKFSDESILLGEVMEKTYDLQVPILPCMCGLAPRLLQGSPYELGLPRCNICMEVCHEDVYHCGSCHFDAHPNCLEMNEKVKAFFHHHPLHLLIKGYYYDKLDTTCYICKESVGNSDWVYRCEHCELDMHALCTKLHFTPKELMEYHLVHDHRLNLMQHHSPKSLLCICCNGEVKTNSWRYTCNEKSCGFDMHPYCALMTLPYTICVFDTSHRFILVQRQRGFHCSICGSLGFSWSYHCKHCNVDRHVECLGDVIRDEESLRSGAYEEFIQEYKTEDNHNMMSMLTRLMEHCFGSDSSEGGILSTSSTTSVAEASRGLQPNIQRLTAFETPDLGAIDFDDADLREKIAAETVERRAKRMAAKAGSLETKAKHLEMLENLERLVLDRQSSKSWLQGDGAVLDAGLKSLKNRKRSVEDDVATLVQSRMRHGPRTCLFFQVNISYKKFALLTSLKADMREVIIMFLCEEPGHQHFADGPFNLQFLGELGEERLQKLQPLLGRGLEVVARAVSALPAQLSGLERVTLPELGLECRLDLRAFDLEKHGKPSKGDEGADALKRAEDSAAEWILSDLESYGTNIFERFGLLRVRYKESETGDCPGYTRGSVAWLCKEHVHRGLEAHILEFYPVKFYNPELN